MSIVNAIGSPGTLTQGSGRRRVGELIAATRTLIGGIAATASARDSERTLPRAELDDLSAAGVLAVTVPASHGGAGGGASAAFEITRILATADPNVAHIPQSHFVYLRLAELAGSAELKKVLFAEVLAGKRIANAQSERGGKTITDISTRLVRDGDEFSVTGEKFYSTGSLLADWLAVLARDEHGVDHIAFLPAHSPGVTILDDWNGFGQRTTASGTIVFDDVRVAARHVAPRTDAVTGPYGYGAFAQGLHAAIDTGLARGALTEAAAFVRTSSRPWFEAGVERAEEDPLLVQRFGELGGTRSADDRLNLHRHWRNARTHTLHDPIRWKLQHLGRHAVQGILPPRGPQL